MKAEEKATELMDKFGSKSLEVLKETFIVWNIKRKQEIKQLNQGNRSDNVLRGLSICDRTLKYWNKVEQIINKKLKQ